MPEYDEIVKIAAVAGAKAAMDRMEKDKAESGKKLKDKFYHNTQTLLINYRDFKSFAQNAISSAEDAVRESEGIDTVESIINLMWDPHNRSEMIVESIKKSAIRTQIIMAHIDGMLSVYQKVCEMSPRIEDKRRYYVLYDRYISDEIMSVEDIAEKYYVDKRTVYSDLKMSTERMARLIFGVDFILKN